MENWLIALIWVLVIALVVWGTLRVQRARRRSKRKIPAPPGAPPTPGRADQPEPFNPLAIAKQLEEPYGSASHPADLLGNPIF